MATISTRRLALLLAGIACFITLDCLAAAGLNGVVRKNQMGGEPLAHVSISAPDAGGPTATDDSGRFNLAFPRLAPGDRVDLDVKLKGWVVVNDLQLSGYNLPKDARAYPLTILLAREAERERYALQYYRLSLEGDVVDLYKRKLAELGWGKFAERLVLARTHSHILAMVDDLARQFAAVKPSDGDVLYSQAAQLFLNNRQDEALALLDEGKLQADATQAIALETNARKMKEETAKNYRLRGQLLTLRSKFGDAAQAYRAATTLLPDDFQSWFYFALIHHELNYYPEARLGYEKALSVARANTYRSEVAMTQRNLAKLESDESHYVEARQGYQEALDIYRDLASINSDIWLIYVAMTLDDLAVLHRVQDHFEEAGKVAHEAFSIYSSLANSRPDIYLTPWASPLNLTTRTRSKESFERVLDESVIALSERRRFAYKYIPDPTKPYEAKFIYNHTNYNARNNLDKLPK